MNVEHMRYFIELERSGSITKAASHLFISPQGLNKALAALEAEVGGQLVERGRRGTRLTDDGRRFLAFAEDTVRGYDELLDGFVRLSSFCHAPNRVLAVGATSYALHTVLGDMLNNEDSESMRIEELSPSAILERTGQRGGTRLFVTDLFEESSLAARALESNAFEPVLRTEFGVISHADYPLEASVLTVDELLDIPFVCFKDESIDWILQKSFGDAQPRSLLLRTSNSDQLVKRVLSKRVVCLLDSFAYHRLEWMDASLGRGLRFTPVEGMPRVTTGFLYRNDEPLESHESEFVQAFKARFAQRFASYMGRYPL